MIALIKDWDLTDTEGKKIDHGRSVLEPPGSIQSVEPSVGFVGGVFVAAGVVALQN